MPGNKIFVINGSASAGSSNERIIDHIKGLMKESFEITIFNDLKSLPHFDPQLSAGNPPQAIKDLRSRIEHSAGVIICTPEYIFSIPSGLKNAIEWCVATVIFTDKPTGIITASAHGQKAHDELIMIMKTVGAKVDDNAMLLIQGVKGKVSPEGEVTDTGTKEGLLKFSEAFIELVAGGKSPQ